MKLATWIPSTRVHFSHQYHSILSTIVTPGPSHFTWQGMRWFWSHSREICMFNLLIKNLIRIWSISYLFLENENRSWVQFEYRLLQGSRTQLAVNNIIHLFQRRWPPLWPAEFTWLELKARICWPCFLICQTFMVCFERMLKHFSLLCIVNFW